MKKIIEIFSAVISITGPLLSIIFLASVPVIVCCNRFQINFESVLVLFLAYSYVISTIFNIENVVPEYKVDNLSRFGLVSLTIVLTLLVLTILAILLI